MDGPDRPPPPALNLNQIPPLNTSSPPRPQGPTSPRDPTRFNYDESEYEVFQTNDPNAPVSPRSQVPYELPTSPRGPKPTQFDDSLESRLQQQGQGQGQGQQVNQMAEESEYTEIRLPPKKRPPQPAPLHVRSKIPTQTPLVRDGNLELTPKITEFVSHINSVKDGLSHLFSTDITSKLLENRKSFLVERENDLKPASSQRGLGVGLGTSKPAPPASPSPLSTSVSKKAIETNNVPKDPTVDKDLSMQLNTGGFNSNPLFGLNLEEEKEWLPSRTSGDGPDRCRCLFADTLSVQSCDFNKHAIYADIEDGVGAFQIFFQLATLTFSAFQNHTNNLYSGHITPSQFEKEGFRSANQIQYLLKMGKMLLKTISGSIAWTQIDEILTTWDVPPFWYWLPEGFQILKKVLSSPEVKSNRAIKTASLADHPNWRRLVQQVAPPLMSTLKFYCPREEGVPKVPIYMFYNIEIPFLQQSNTTKIGLIKITQKIGLIKITQKVEKGDSVAHKAGKRWTVPLIFHIGGTGLIPGSNQEPILREMAASSKALVVSVLYSTPPHAFPKALEECYHVYKWIVHNNFEWHIVPTKIILIGDSLGGNLALSTYFRAVIDNIRLPDSLILYYPILNLTNDLRAFPSRTLFMNDAFLPIKLLEMIQTSYTKGVDPTNYLLSPLCAPDWLLLNLPKELHLFSASLDPLLDDLAHFMRRLNRLGVPFNHKSYLQPHGFLNFACPAFPVANNAKFEGLRLMKRILEEVAIPPAQKKYQT